MPGNQLPRYIANFSYLGLPPEDARNQMLQIWHLEHVLRHYVWVRLRTENGDPWKGNPALCELFDKLEKWRDNAIDHGEYTLKSAPNLLWFAGLGDLCRIIESFRGLSDEFLSAVNDVKKYRNLWAHFHPVDPQQAGRELFAAVGSIEQVLSKWSDSYWNADVEVDTGHWLVREYQRNKESVPLLTKPIPGVHGGFSDPTLPLDRGWSMLLLENDACYWVELAAVGCRRDFGIDELRTYGVEMQEFGIHVAASFEEGERIDACSDGFYMLRICFSKADDRQLLLTALRRLSDITKRLPLSVGARSDEPKQLNKEFVTQQLFYRAPWNVIVAPVQEYRRVWTARAQ